MHCPACQGTVEESDRHCRHCGAALVPASVETAGGQPAATSRSVRGWWYVVLALAVLGIVLVAFRSGAPGHDRIESPSGPVAGAPFHGKEVDPVVAVSHAAVTLISILDEYFDATGELPLSLTDTGFSAEDIHPGIAVDYERDTGRIHVASKDGKLHFSAVLESPTEGDSWWVCRSDSLPHEEWPARCSSPEAPATAQPAEGAPDDGMDAPFPVGEREGNGEGDAAAGSAPVEGPAAAKP